MQQYSNPTIKTYIKPVDQTSIAISDHAKTRMKQRGIKLAWVTLLLEYGYYAYQNSKNTYSIYLNKTGIKQIKKHFGDIVDLSKLRSIYLVLSDDSVLVTCAYR